MNKVLCLLSSVRLILKPKLNLRLTFLLHKQTFFSSQAQNFHEQFGSFIPLAEPVTRMWILEWARSHEIIFARAWASKL